MTPGNNSAQPNKVQEYVRRLTTLEEDRREQAGEIRDLKKEAANEGLDPKALMVLVKRGLEDAEQRERREEFEATLDTYLAAAGLIG